MQLILTHENADFDAVASQLAAHKLYPDGVPLLSRRINRNVSQFLALYWDALPFLRASDWKRKRVHQVLLVDTQTLTSVRGLIKHPQVHVIDHHDGPDGDTNWTYQVETVGATTTLLVEGLQQSGLRLTPEEATLLLLGIHEDTGSLTYAGTTSRDVLSAAWLMEQGAHLDVVRRFLNIPLTPSQRGIYEQLQGTAEWLELAGQSLVVATAVAPEPFEEEVSSVVHRLRDALSPAGLFVLVQIRDGVQLVARSASANVDVASVARALGGGGHNRAAAALIIGEKLAEVREKLLELLPLAVRPMALVEKIMSRGVQTLPADATVEEAAVRMRRFGHEGYPVVDPEQQKLIGLLTRRAVDRAMSHEMGPLPVSRIMKAGVVTVRPSDSVERVQQLMLDEGWGQIPVVADDAEMGTSQLIGVVTRTDVLNHLFKPPKGGAGPDMKRLMGKMLPQALWQMVLAISGAAAELGMPVYFVGGLVRDLLLHKPPTDLDMVVEGDAITLARTLQGRAGGQIHSHSRFGTAKWLVSDDEWRKIAPECSLDGVPETIDFVTARTEFYAEPSALPQVKRGSIKLDLHRRDFTINTLAVRLDGAHLGELLDFYGGRRDLEQGIIRVLHSLSFIDDPTRILRAIRLEQRLGFTIEPRTAELIATALPMMSRMTGDRIRHELELALHERVPARILRRMAELGVLPHIHPALQWIPEAESAFARVPGMIADPMWQAAVEDDRPTFVYFALWMTLLSPPTQAAVMARLRVRKTTREDVIAVSQVLRALQALPPNPRPSEVERVLRTARPRVLLAASIATAGTAAADLITRYFREWRQVRTAVTGDDLRAMGLKPGPLYGRLLDRLLAARLDGEVHDEEGERALLNQLLQEQS
ncbi:MAG: CBS domain-containing protein [Anaerolineae bacterium]